MCEGVSVRGVSMSRVQVEAKVECSDLEKFPKGNLAECSGQDCTLTW